MARNLILVTGMPRSGTTVIGERLLGARSIELYEPMNLQVGDLSIKHQFTLPGEDGLDDAGLDRFVKRLRNGVLFGKYPPKHSPRHPLFNRTRRTMLRTLLDRRAETVIWKDPFAVFIAPRLPERGVPVVVTVRDPLASAASFQRMNWSFDTGAFQKRLRQIGFETEPFPSPKGNVREESASAARLWALTHRYLLDQIDRQIPLALIGIEGNLSAPEKVAQRLKEATGITPQLAEAATQSTDTSEPLPEQAHIKNRSAESVTKYWKKILTEDEASYVRELTDDLYARIQPRLALD
ncbi:hypothetical protein [Celeribacter baekdonensis]|uniref:hypothetical protein n=1 Tax=Pseudomonadota TaxID=1224 RepID=UPI003A90F8A4